MKQVNEATLIGLIGAISLNDFAVSILQILSAVISYFIITAIKNGKKKKNG